MISTIRMALLSALLILPSFAVQADTSGSISLASDYFWRGVSQNAGNPALQAGLAWNHGSGVYASAWTSQVDFGDDANIQYDLVAGYNLAVTNDMTIGAGILQRNFDAGYDDVEELFVDAVWKNTNMTYYVNSDNRKSTYFELSQGLPFITFIDTKIGYGSMKETGTNSRFVSLNLSKNISDSVTVGLMVLDGVRHGDMLDSAAITFAYNF
jgi:uncharacterized protein (TIGR02001 family)